MKKLFTQTFTVSAAECNAQGCLSLNSLVFRIITIATDHANSLGIGNPVMASIGAGWVLARLTLQMTGYPPAYTDYTITTWVETWNRRFSERCFEITAPDGHTLGYARSVWVVMGTDSHTNVGLDHLTLPDGIIADKPCPIARQSKYPAMSADTPGVTVSVYTFRYTDIDFYGHVNTLRYLQLLQNRFPMQLYATHLLHRFEIAFMHECYYGETATILALPEYPEETGTPCHAITLTTPRATCVRARLSFTPQLSLQYDESGDAS